ncbi:UNC93-like protein MFSD11 isoform X1 [Lepisosteus oculatus]|uniref:UNC93-like protein MFSD11 isoform X1 n=2 Tax=Lepisosteus oculatus TaxID=7918 RepID=UPI0003EABE02|nr:PREDICTED: UNC93-like protein MFSD11 isoform X1 [Lepisosteus oculatus]
MADFRTFNVVILGIGFLLIFTAFTTCGNIEQTVIKSLANTTFEGSGYNSFAIIYGVFAASNFIAPSVIAVIGPKLTMMLSGLLYSGYIAAFILPATWSFYLTSFLIGVAAAMLWTAQGNFLVLNSDASTINKNTGLFWALLQCSMLFGNLYIYFDWNGKITVTDKDRMTVFVVLLVLSLLGTLSFIVLRKNCDPDEAPNEENDSLLPASMIYKQRALSAVREATTEFRTMINMFGTKTIFLLSFCMAYSGLELTFYSGVYGTCIGATAQFGTSAKGLIGLSGILVGIGEIVGGGLFGLLCKNSRFRRTSVVFLGMMVHFISFYLIFLNIPDDAPIVFESVTVLEPYLTPSVPVTLMCSFLLGLGDSCFNTQIYSLLGCLYAEQSSPAFAIFKFIQSVCAAVAFFYSNYLLLSWQLLLMVILGFAGTLCFFLVEKTQGMSADLQEY